MAFSYSCKDFPGMKAYPGAFTAATEPELWKHIELHAREAHHEDPTKWSAHDKQGVRNIIRSQSMGQAYGSVQPSSPGGVNYASINRAVLC